MYIGQKVNPFVEYCKENNVKEGEKFDYRKHGIKQSNNKDSSIVIRLRFLKKVNNPYIVSNKKLVKSYKDNKNEAMLIYDSLSSYCTRVYKDKNNQMMYFMPIYKMFINNNSGEIRKELDYYRETFKQYVGKDLNDVDHYMDIYNNEYVRFEDKNGLIGEGLVLGFHKANNKIVIKNCSKSITKNTIKIEKIKSDVLGLYNLNF